MKEFTYYFWTFIFGSILGVIIETVWCVLKYKKIESRKGVIYGPFNPLYGIATLTLSFSLNCISSKSVGSAFIVGAVIASFLEYLCSYYQEKLTGSVSWDYKDFKYNLNGRVNLVYSIGWGILTIIWYLYFMPIVDSLMPIFNKHSMFTILFFIFIVLDCLISLCACIRRKKRHENVYAKTKFEKHLDYFYTDDLLDKVYANSIVIDKN